VTGGDTSYSGDLGAGESVQYSYQLTISKLDYGQYEYPTTLVKRGTGDSSQSEGVIPFTVMPILSIPSVFIVGLLAGFNPCLFAILAFIASVALASTGKRRNVFYIVAAFSLGIFVTYLVFGLGILQIIQSFNGIQDYIRIFLVLLLGILGVWHVYDAWHMKHNPKSTFYTPKSFIRLTESMTERVNLPAAFFLGALFSLIKAPCVGAVYFVILDMVKEKSIAGMGYLAVYNLGVVLPVFLIGIAIAFGMKPETVENYRDKHRSGMRLVTGITLLVIAVLMYFKII
ncbi:MAG: cytochrome c biogenesis protein CcdA, partial [Methanosarcinales archaeon]|nr:cytochrome c biogenesis protein CcdA [Methanosarcinales archaeon]